MLFTHYRYATGHEKKNLSYFKSLLKHHYQKNPPDIIKTSFEYYYCYQKVPG